MVILLLAAAVVAATSLAVVSYQRAERLSGQMETIRAAGRTPSAQPAGRITPEPPAETEPDGESGLPTSGDISTAAWADLEARIREKDAIIAQLRQAATNEPSERRRDRPWEDRTEWLERLKTEEPERYAELMERREKARRDVQNAFARKAAFFLGRNTEGMTDDQNAEYNRMLTLLEDTWTLSERIQNDELPREERREVMHALRDNTRELAPLLENERTVEFMALGYEMGYGDAEAADFAAYVNEIIDITSMRSVFQGMWAGRGFGTSPGNRSDENRTPRDDNGKGEE